GKVRIPRGTDLAFGFTRDPTSGVGGMLEEFAKSQNAVSVFTAYDKRYIGISVGDPREVLSFFDSIANKFIDNGGRLKFNLTGLLEGREGVTTAELRRILKIKSLEKATDFFEKGLPLSGPELEERLAPWRR